MCGKIRLNKPTLCVSFIFLKQLLSLINMTDFRENLGWIIGSITTAIAMVVGWLISSGVVVNLLFLLVGFGITYFVQTRTQKRAWKREYSVKIAETVYGTLFKDMKNLIRSLERKNHDWLNFLNWGQIQEDHRYLMVDEKFRQRLDQFSERVERYSRATSQLRNVILPKILIEETEKIFETKVDEKPRLDVKYMEGRKRVSTSPNLVECLVSKTHPIDDATRNKSEISGIECIVEIKPIDGQAIHDTTKFDEFWKSCLVRMEEDKTYKFIIEENQKLLEEANKMQKELIQRIEKPWRI